MIFKKLKEYYRNRNHGYSVELMMYLVGLAIIIIVSFF